MGRVGHTPLSAVEVPYELPKRNRSISRVEIARFYSYCFYSHHGGKHHGNHDGYVVTMMVTTKRSPPKVTTLKS